MNEMLKVAYDYGRYMAFLDAGLLKEGQGFKGVEQMKEEALKKHSPQSPSMTRNIQPTPPGQQREMQAKWKAHTQPPPQVAPKPAAPPKAVNPVLPGGKGLPPVQQKPPSNLLTRAPGAIQRRKQMLRRYR